MDNLCKQYINDAKTLFPIMGKNEKEYFKNLELNIKDYCEETALSSLEELYKNWGTPVELVNSYFLHANTDYILRQIRRTKVVKTTLIALIISALIAVSAYCTFLYSSYKVFKDEQIFSEQTFIE